MIVLVELLEKWRVEAEQILTEFFEKVEPKPNQLLVVGCSTSEIIGQSIGTSGSTEVAEIIFQTCKRFAEKAQVQLAFQCCEHLNRALVIERKTAELSRLEEVSVVPVPKAGGSMAAYAYRHFSDPVVVEHIKADLGIDIGDTFIGMHLKHVLVPVRVSGNQIGGAHVTLARTRPKLIGGERAVYRLDNQNQSCQL